jgi:hypothetical protein
LEEFVLRSRRTLFVTLAEVAGFLAVAPMLTAQMSPQPMPSPHAPDPHFPPGLDGPQVRPDSGTKQVDPEVEARIKQDVRQLYLLASDLRLQVEKANPGSTLSLSVVKDAQEIEKLAKQVKNLAKG